MSLDPLHGRAFRHQPVPNCPQPETPLRHAPSPGETAMNVQTETVTLDEACRLLDEAKAREAAANVSRLEAEKLVLALVGELPEEGTTRKPVGPYQLVIATNLRRAVDADRLRSIAAQIPEAIGKRLIKWKPELVTRELRYLQDNEPMLYRVVAEAITATPAKPSIKLEPAKKEAA